MGEFDPKKHLMDLKGKEYLPVAWRLVWLRTVCPNATIQTKHIEITPDWAIFQARVILPDGGEATGYGSETPKDFRDYIEKAETKAIGRALAALGYGTQFAPELDEGIERIVDSPIERPHAPVQEKAQSPGAPVYPKPEPTIMEPDAPASEKQINFIKGLGKQKGHDTDAMNAFSMTLFGSELEYLNKGEASEFISRVKAGDLPKSE